MATYRNVQMSFWNDPDVIDNYTAEDRLFYLYALTNPHTNLCGCYEISLGQIAYETGLSREEIDQAVNRAETVHKTIVYSRETKELLILNWSKYNWTESDKVRTVIAKEIQKVKEVSFRQYLSDLFDGVEVTYGINTISENPDRVSIGYQYPIQDGVYVSNNNKLNIDNKVNINNKSSGNTNKVNIDNNSISNNKEKEIRKDIIDYLNNKRGTRFKSEANSAVKNIKARLKEGYSLEDFYKVIDTKVAEWTGTDFEKYLTPETLFGNKFDKYLNQNPNKSSSLETKETDNTVAPEDENEEIISEEEYEELMREQYGEDVYIQS